MAVIVANGCFDLLHEGHKEFLVQAKLLGVGPQKTWDEKAFQSIKRNRLVVAVNTDASAQHLKLLKWGSRYPIDDLTMRTRKLKEYADEVVSFDTEEELKGIIEFLMPCIIVKGPDYANKYVTGQDIAPVIILDTPETEQIRQLKRQAYGLDDACNVDKP